MSSLIPLAPSVPAQLRRLILVCALLTVIALNPAPAPGQSAPPGTDIYLAPLSLGNGSIEIGRPVNITSRPGYDNQPFFAFDGSFVLFTAADTSGATDIFRYDTREATTTRVTQTTESEYSPTLMPGERSFSTVRVEADGAQRLWQFDIDGAYPRLVLTDVDSVGYHAWIDDRTLALFVLGEPHTLRIADTLEDTDQIVAFDIGRCIHTVPGTSEISFVQIVSDDESWITSFDLDSGEFLRLVTTIPGSQDYAWIPGGGMLMADGSALFVWAGEDEWTEVAAFGHYGITNITRLAVSASGEWLALVADDS
jgi:hypothetical protein